MFPSNNNTGVRLAVNRLRYNSLVSCTAGQTNKGGILLANLTSTELQALEDQMGQEQTLIKKYQAMANLCGDTQIQQCLNDFANKHQQHFNSLMGFLQ